MAFCPNCGQQIADQAVVCIHCGSQLGAPAAPAKQDSNSFGWFCLGFCIPIVGLILWLVWKAETPMKAKKAGLGALISTIASIVIWVIYFIIIVAVVGTSGGYYYY